MSIRTVQSAAQRTVDPAALFDAYHSTLRARVRSVVNTSQANVEDACMFARVALLGHELEHVAGARGWLLTVAVRLRPAKPSPSWPSGRPERHQSRAKLGPHGTPFLASDRNAAAGATRGVRPPAVSA